MNEYTSEIYRKTFHLSSIWIPVSYYFLTSKTMFTIISCLSFVALIVEFSRKNSPELNQLISKTIGKVMRNEEKDKFSGATFLLLSSTLCIILFSKEITIFALSTLIISDACAALIGKKYGKHKLLDKSLEGSAAFLISALIIYLNLVFFNNFDLPFWGSSLAIVCATIVELIAKKIHVDDNFAIPLIIGIILSLF